MDWSFCETVSRFSLNSFNQLSVIKGNKEPQKQRVSEMEQEELEDEYISTFDCLNIKRLITWDTHN